MKPKKSVILLILTLTSIVFAVEAITITTLYQAAITEEKSRLKETATSQARLIESVARFNNEYTNDYPGGPRQATLNQIKDAHAHYPGFNETGEFTLSTKEKDEIVFLLNHRHFDLDNPKPVPWKSELAVPMRRALSGQSGTVIAQDYRGVKVLAAYEPVGEINLGIVAKIDLSEIREPFIKASFISGLSALVLIAIGVSLFFKVTNPIITRLYNTVAKLKNALEEIRTLRGILPICSFCKKIKDDTGYWNRLEAYVTERSHAEFSHGICPECAQKHYPECFRNQKTITIVSGNSLSLSVKPIPPKTVRYDRNDE